MNLSSLMTSPGESLPLNIGLHVSGLSFGFSGSPCFFQSGQFKKEKDRKNRASFFSFFFGQLKK